MQEGLGQNFKLLQTSFLWLLIFLTSAWLRSATESPSIALIISCTQNYLMPPPPFCLNFLKLIQAPNQALWAAPSLSVDLEVSDCPCGWGGGNEETRSTTSLRTPQRCPSFFLRSTLLRFKLAKRQKKIWNQFSNIFLTSSVCENLPKSFYIWYLLYWCLGWKWDRPNCPLTDLSS